ncbi:PilN domain-containing protein [uncultured Neptuniibacter sp.]|uniref:PilN domain-containing protein n=1 Tax=uncultured Neptuniibacter sp. TaxID=502143 RepID=UPI00260B26A7|nr:PilN domain-containing protein [uncultured Neptuniibacter sp.]
MEKQALPEARSAAHQFADQVQRFWCWWTGELGAMLPESLLERFKAKRTYMVIELHPEQSAIRYGQKGELIQLATIDYEQGRLGSIPHLTSESDHADEVICLLPPVLLLTKKISLPLVTASNIDNVLRFEMDRYTPFSADQVYYGYRIEPQKSGSKMLEITLSLIHKTQLDPLLDQFKQAGIRVNVVAPAADSSRELYSMNLLPQVKEKKTLAFSLPLKIVLILALLIFALFFLLQWQEQQVETLRTQSEIPRQKAEQAQQISAELKNLAESQQFLQNRKEATVSRLILLKDLTTRMPDHTWINNFQLDGSTLKLQGESNEASSLIGLLEDSTLLQNVRFSSPVTQNANSKKGRFAVIAQIGKEAP